MEQLALYFGFSQEYVEGPLNTKRIQLLDLDQYDKIIWVLGFYGGKE